MKDWKKVLSGIVWMLTACLCSLPAAAQQEGEDKPKPAAREYPPLFDPNGNQEDSDQGAQTMQPDNWPVSGVQNPTLGTPAMRHSYWVPGIQYSNTAGSNSSNPGTNTGWNSTSFVTGNVSLLEAWSHSLLSANYSGGGYFSTDKVQGNGNFHQLAAAFEIDQRRWQVFFDDQFSYLPLSSFGFGGTSGLASPGITGSLGAPQPGLQNAFVPGQSILTATGPRLSNVSAVQLTYELSARGSFTIAGVHGLLRFTNSGNLDNNTETLNAGYNYAVTRNDTLGLSYRFSAYHYPADPQALGDHVIQVVYGKKITGRLALKLMGGPEVTRFRVPVNGSRQNVSGSGTASLIYAFRQSNVTLNYTHGVSSGSGVFSGANTDQINATWGRPLTRVWYSNMNLGYARNRQILGGTGVPSTSFGTWLAGAGLSRPLGRSANLSGGYQAQIQDSSIGICTGPNCGSNRVVHQIFLSLQWHARPVVLR